MTHDRQPEHRPTISLMHEPEHNQTQIIERERERERERGKEWKKMREDEWKNVFYVYLGLLKNNILIKW